jgi:hypothetical protein
LTDLTHEIREG